MHVCSKAALDVVAYSVHKTCVSEFKGEKPHRVGIGIDEEF
jgi:hypothetical protein